MRGPKYLLYLAAFVVFVWGINGVTTAQPDKPSATGAVTPVRSIVTGSHDVSRSDAPMTVAATVTPGK